MCAGPCGVYLPGLGLAGERCMITRMALRWIFGAAFSLANLLYFPVWASLLEPAHQFFSEAAPPRAAFVAALIGVATLTLVLTALFRFCDNGRAFVRLVARTIMVFLTVLLLTELSVEFARTFPDLRIVALGVLLSLVVLLLVFSLGFPATSMRFVRFGLLIFVPFGVMIVAQGVWAIVEAPQILNPGPSQASAQAHAPTGNSLRLVWIVYDEMDFGISLRDRPAGLALPELDRLRAEAFFAENAHPPAGWTHLSMPALLTGLDIVEARPLGVNDLNLVLLDGRVLRWSEAEDVFVRARKLGVDSGMVGSFLPYCRIVGLRLRRCHWRAGGIADYWNGADLQESLRAQAWLLIRSIPGFDAQADRMFSVWKRRRARAGTDFWALQEEAARLAADDAVGLVVVHLPVPHPPSVPPGETYLDNLAVTDESLSRLRRAMEGAGLWQRTALLVTSDHPIRAAFWQSKAPEELEGIELTEDPRVPFLLKLPSSEAVTYSPQFSTDLSADLVIEILAGKLRTHQEVSDWIAGRRRDSGTR